MRPAAIPALICAGLSAAAACCAAGPLAWGEPADGMRLGAGFAPGGAALRVVLENTSREARGVLLGYRPGKDPIYNLRFYARSPEGEEREGFDIHALAPMAGLMLPVFGRLEPGAGIEMTFQLREIIFPRRPADPADTTLDRLLEQGYAVRVSFEGQPARDVMGGARGPALWLGKVESGAVAGRAPEFEARAVVTSHGAWSAPLAPGALMSIYGRYLGPWAGCADRVPSYPKSLCDVQVLVDGAPVGLLYAQERQINFQVPHQAPTEGTADVRVVYQGRSSKPVTLRRAGLDFASVSLDGPARVGLPVWLKVEMPHRGGWVRYPFGIHPADFGCHEVEVRRDGQPLPRIASLATQAFGGVVGSGPLCGSLGLPSQPNRVGGIPLHLQYRFDRPGIYEVRYSFRNDRRTGAAPAARSAWTAIEILPEPAGGREAWLRDFTAREPGAVSDLLADFLPGLLGVPEPRSLARVAAYLYHPDSVVRRFAMYGLTYWPAAEADAAVAALLRTKGPSGAVVEFLARAAASGGAPPGALVGHALGYLKSESPLLVEGAVTAVYRVALTEKPRVAPALRARAEAALIEAAGHVAKTANTQTLVDYACALGLARDARAGAALWSLIERKAAREQAAIALTWRRAPEDLPKLARLASAPLKEQRDAWEFSGLPYALRRGYGDAAIPFLEDIIVRAESQWVRAACARELVPAGRAAGFAFLADAIERDRPYRREMTEFVRGQFPELRHVDDAAVLVFLQTRAGGR